MFLIMFRLTGHNQMQIKPDNAGKEQMAQEVGRYNVVLEYTRVISWLRHL